MRILITNDDGIAAAGLRSMHALAMALAGPKGDVWTVAPAFEQSGVGHCISYIKPMMISKQDERRFAVEGTPADCVLASIHELMKDAPPDLVLSGVNRGNNSAENVLYSGTIGAAMEAALQGIPAIALSQYLGPRTQDLSDPFEAAAHHGLEVIQKILQNLPSENTDYPLFFNVNFPPVAAHEVKGLRLAPQGRRQNTGFRTQSAQAPSGRHFLWTQCGDQRAPCAEGQDAALNLEGYISVTPMRADLTDYATLSSLKGLET